MGEQQQITQGHACGAHDCSQQMGEERQASVGEDECRVRGVESRLDELADTGDVDAGVF